METIATAPTWPPEYSIRKSKRARHVNLVITRAKGLELIVPQRFNHDELSKVLDSKRRWIEKHLREIQQQNRIQAPGSLPSHILLRSIGERWQINYLPSDSTRLRMIPRPHQELTLLGDINDKPKCKNKLLDWLKQQGKKHLVSWLQDLSEQTGLSYKNATIRGQQTRWGSCTPNKTINLNYKLLFLPSHLVEHILIHELCHTEYLNHSRRFWKLVERFDPDWRHHNHEIRKTQDFIPLWLE